MGESKKSDFSYAENEDKGLQAFSQIFAMKDRQIVGLFQENYSSVTSYEQ